KWLAAFAVQGRAGSLRRLFDWHRAKGLWLWLGTFALAVTSVTLAFPEGSRDLVRPFSPVGERLHETMPPAAEEGADVGMDRAVASVAALGRRIFGLRPFPEQGVYGVRSYDPRDPDDQGRLWTYVRMSDGAIVAERHDVGESAG